jgi:SAM-dependent methyltransferase
MQEPDGRAMRQPPWTADGSAVVIRRPQLPSEPCPVCRSHATDPLPAAKQARYWQCASCWAIFIDPAGRPTPKAEAAYYALHDNRVDDPRYRAFLSRLATPVLQRVAAGSHGLDFGCGAAPALAHLLREAGQQVAIYDPLFMPDNEALQAQYDFITLSEVAEHMHDPSGEFTRLFAMLRPGGLLAVMTGFPPPLASFEHWHYRRDPTHVVFYRPSTLHWLAQHHDAVCEIPCANVALMRLRATGRS